MGIPVVIASAGGMPVTVATSGYGTPMTEASNGFGVPVTIVASGGLPVVGISGDGVGASGRYTTWWDTLATGNRTALITITSTNITVNGGASKLINGSYSNEVDWTPGITNAELKLDFGVGATVICDGFGWRQDAGVSQGTWVFEGSNDDATYTQFGSSFLLLQTTVNQVFHSFTNYNPYRYYKLRQVGGVTSNAPYIIEWEHRISSATTARDACESGDRTATITVTTNATLAAGSISNLIDGGYDTSVADCVVFTNGQTLREIKFDLGSGVTKRITDFIWVQTGAASHGTWVMEGSNNDAAYTQLGASFTLGGVSLDKHNLSNSTAYRYYRLRQTAGTMSDGPYVLEVEFLIADEASVTYTGPGDIVPGATVWGGLRAYTAAYAAPGTNPAIDIVKASDGTAEQTINILSTGALDVATIAALGYAVKIKKVYDQTGNGRHLTRGGTLALMPTLTLNAIGSLPGVTFDRTNDTGLNTISTLGSHPQPWTFSTVAKRTGSTFRSALAVSGGRGLYLEPSQEFLVFGGAIVPISGATDNTFLALQGTGNGAASIASINGASTTINAGDNALGDTFFRWGHNLTEGLDGLMTEIGLWPIAFSAANNTAMSANQRAYWGF